MLEEVLDFEFVIFFGKVKIERIGELFFFFWICVLEVYWVFLF